MITYGLYNSQLKKWEDDEFNLVLRLLYDEGGVWTDDDLVPIPGGGMTVNVSDGLALVKTDSNIFGEVIKWFRNTSTVNVALANGHPSLPRYDLICAKIDQVNKIASIVSSADDILMKGVPNANPQIPITPINYCKLGHVYVPPGANNISSCVIYKARNVANARIKYNENNFFNYSNPNFVMNANFDWCRRNPSRTSNILTPIGGFFVADRWFDSVSGNGGYPPTLTRSINEFNVGELPKSRYYARLTTNGAGSGYGSNAYHYFGQRILHGVRNLCGIGKSITVRFIARSNIPGKKLGICLEKYYGTGGSASEVITGTYFTLTPNLTEYIFTFPASSNAGKTITNNDFLELQIWYMWGSIQANYRVNDTVAETYKAAGYIDIAQVQVNSGSYALPFYPKDPYLDRQDCMRFWNKSYRDNVLPGSSTGVGSCFFAVGDPSTSTIGGTIYFGVPMCRIPTITTYDLAGNAGKCTRGTGNASVTAYAENATEQFFTFYSFTGVAANVVYVHWVADAEPITV